MALPVIATNWSGVTEYLDDSVGAHPGLLRGLVCWSSASPLCYETLPTTPTKAHFQHTQAIRFMWSHWYRP